METVSSSLGGMSPKPAPVRRHAVNSTAKDIWTSVRNGTVHDVEVALAHLKKTNGNIDARNTFGSSPLHISVWRNHLPIVKRLLAAGANPNARDGESGWSSLHRALHFRHLAVAGLLIEAGGSLVVEDSKGRTPIDLTSSPLKQSLASSSNKGAKEVFSWGNGSNYQLGIGSTGILRVPGRVDVLEGLDVIAVAAAKFHSVALTASGEVYSWGFGRGGRLGHPDFDIHSGQVAVISPRKITNSFGSRGVSVIAVAKHHTVVATYAGEVYTWGSNREGRLGYPSVDTQPTPRRVNTLKARVVGVAAANKHTAVLTEAGEVYTWGCNTEGQLGYGTSNSISNCLPRVVECLKGGKLVSVSTAKYHTIVLGAEGEVLTWGYKMVNPRRIIMVRYTKKAGSLPLKFHIAGRLHVVAISAGMTHSLALSEDGLVFYWFSADPQLRCHQLLSMPGHQVVAASSSKYRTAVATSTGDVYSWDGENSQADTIPVPVRVQGIKHAVQLSVGENHSVVVAAFFTPGYPLVAEWATTTNPLSKEDDGGDVDPELEDEGVGVEEASPKKEQITTGGVLRALPSLRDLCEKVIAQSILEPKNALQVLEFADSLGADFLKQQCEELIVQNLDYILTMAPVLFGQVKPSLLAQAEFFLYASSSQPWSHRQLPNPKATPPAIIDSDEEGDVCKGNAFVRGVTRESQIFNKKSDKRMSEGFLQQGTENGEAILKQVRAVKKKLQQIETLERKQAKGLTLDVQQLTKLQTKGELEELLSSLESGIIPDPGKKFHKQEVKNEIDLVDKLHSVGETLKSRTVGSREQRRLEKRRSKGEGSSGDLYMSRVEAASATPSTATGGSTCPGIPENKSLQSLEVSGVGCDSSPTRSHNFVTISGFTSSTVKDSEMEAAEKGVCHGRSKMLVKGGLSSGSGFPTEPRAMSTKMTGPGPVLPPEQLPRMTTPGKRIVKGGLSVFLSGALDELPKPVVPSPAPVTPKVEGPAWGGARIPKGSISLLTIQSQQKVQPSLSFSQTAKVESGLSSSEERNVATCIQIPNIKHVAITKMVTNTKQVDKSQIVVEDTESNSKHVPLSQFVRTSPITVTNNLSSSNLHLENSPPPWAGVMSSPSSLSLRDIQLQQVKSKAQQRPSNSRGSPNLASPVGASTLSAGGSSSEQNLNSVDTPNRWFKPEAGSPSTLRCIQIEEKAMKELRQLYKNVKLVRNDGS